MLKYLFWQKNKECDQGYVPVVLLTGCSSGIGLATAKLLASRKEYRIIVTTRDKSMGVLSREFSDNDHVWILPLDVASEESRKALVEKVILRWGRVDILINNAGICYRSVLEEMQDKDEMLQIQTNYLGPVSLIRLLLPRMRKNGRGKIINISSVSGIMGMPTMASYTASKFALEGAMEALWYEARPFGVDVSLIQPGFVRSVSHERVKFSVRSGLSNEMVRAYSDIYRYMTPFITRFMTHGIATPESIAKLVLLTIKTEKPNLWIPASIDAKLMFYLKRFLPRSLLLHLFFRSLPGSQRWGVEFRRTRKRPLWIMRVWRNSLRQIGATVYGKT